MSQRSSGYALRDANEYVTPQWCYDLLFAAETFENPWDCCPVNADFDFLELTTANGRDIVTNPPYGLRGEIAYEIASHALTLTKAHRGKVALLLSMGYDCGKTRQDLFGLCPFFKRKLVLLDRIRWSPDTPHAWFVWDWDVEYGNRPTISYLRRDGLR